MKTKKESETERERNQFDKKVSFREFQINQLN